MVRRWKARLRGLRLRAMARTEFVLSTRRRSLAMARYLLAVVLSALAGALLLRMFDGPMWAGALLGGFIAVPAFRDQLRPLSWPRLYLSQKAAYLVHRRRALGMGWPIIARIEPEGTLVEIAFVGPVNSPDQGSIEGVRLEAAKMGASVDELTQALRAAKADPSSLPTDEQVRERFGQRVMR